MRHLFPSFLYLPPPYCKKKPSPLYAYTLPSCPLVIFIINSIMLYRPFIPLALFLFSLTELTVTIAQAKKVHFKSHPVMSEECSSYLASPSFLEASSCNSHLLPQTTSSREPFVSELKTYCEAGCKEDQVISELRRFNKTCIAPGTTIGPDHPAYRSFIDLYRAIPDQKSICAIQPSTGQWCLAPVQPPSSGYYGVEVNGSGCGECPHAVRQARMSWKAKVLGIAEDTVIDRKVLQETKRCSDTYQDIPGLEGWIHQESLTAQTKKSSSSPPVLRPLNHPAFSVLGTLFGSLLLFSS